MIGLLKDLPDWMVGTAISAAAWYGVCHEVLAPRMIEETVETDIKPSCVAKLRAQEKGVIDREVERLTQAAMRDIESQKAKLMRKRSSLMEASSEAKIMRDVAVMYNESPLGMLVQMPDFALDTRPLDRQISELSKAIADLKVPEFEVPPVPTAEVMTHCACAATHAVSDSRSAYAISLASFRFWNPEEIGSLGAEVTRTLSGGACGPKPWETRS